ncbi:pyridoxal phosphate-dependent aminotransferase [Methylobacterium isbiliense]|jgi:aspartate/methionine/tyrosine aminotransferase|uniref:8-amino-7-oxononanoate synthase n=1 Tax=Methylobacterium isbiliense TaxID=315478 RepID=A0ABQ4SAX9_9HYPH|nr:pyridoxal phosphate-dependent aminotransferase [Methylobacterium isbiliense]MDN3621954.1 pyridoxal phosphate-dependent aminotransferase [Methylobacterium isbiliense]GJD99532.1 Aspartate aminotransferase [Methylobacterium isbiliense]
MTATTTMPPINPVADGVLPSGIGEVIAYGAGRTGLIPLWVGEGDRPTPDFIGEAAARALRDGHTFYTDMLGIPALRQEIAAYVGRLYGGSPEPDRFFVTVGGMQAFQIALAIAAQPGDEIVIPTPIWPNFFGAIAAHGAKSVTVPIGFDPASGWSLDVERLAAAVTPRTRALVINSPANPTGWTASRDDLRALLTIARRHDLWIIADEIYGRFSFDPAHADLGRAPSFRDVWEPDDHGRVLFVQTFSKNWAMTGWRLGWLEGPPALGRIVAGLVLYGTSGIATFLQHAAVTALREGEPLVRAQIAQAREGRRILCEGLGRLPGVALPPPAGAFYAFPQVATEPDARRLALRLVDEANVGVAPGTAFGPGGEGFLRLCFARSAADLQEAVHRLAPVLASPGARP